MATLISFDQIPEYRCIPGGKLRITWLMSYGAAVAPVLAAYVAHLRKCPTCQTYLEFPQPGIEPETAEQRAAMDKELREAKR